MSKSKFQEGFRRKAYFPKTEISYMTLRKLRSIKSRVLGNAAGWEEYLTYLSKDVNLSPTLHERVQFGTFTTLLNMWMRNLADNLPFIRSPDAKTIADLAVLEPLIEGESDYKTSTATPVNKRGVNIKNPVMGSAIVVGRGPSLFQNKHCEMLKKSNYKGKICVPPGTSILCNPVVKDIANVELGDKVVSHDGKYHSVTQIFKHSFKGELIKITPRSIKIPFSVTPEHPILARQFTDKIGKYRYRGTMHTHPPVWISAKELKIGDYIALPVLQNVSEENSLNTTTFFNYPLIEVDGRIYKKQVRQHLRSTATTTPDDIEKRHIAKPTLRKNIPRDDLLHLYLKKKTSFSVIAKLFGVSVHCVKGNLHRYGISRLNFHRKGKGIPKEITLTSLFLKICGYYIAEGSTKGKCGSCVFSFGKHELSFAKEVQKFGRLIGLNTNITRSRPDVVIATINSTMLRDLFSMWFGKGAENKKIPQWIMHLPSQKIAQFLKGLWAGDGWATDKSLRYATVSKTLAYQLVLLLSKIGIRAAIHTDKNTQDGSFGNRLQYRIDVESHREKLANLLNMSINTRKKTYTRKDTFFEDNLLWYRVQETTKIPYEGEVYNLEIAESNSYLCELTLTHNCSSDGGMIPLLEAGVIPEYVVSVDGAPVIKKFFDHPLVREHGHKIKWICTTTVNHKVMLTGKKNGLEVYWFSPIFDDIRELESFTRQQKLLTSTDHLEHGIARASSGGNSGACAWVMASVLLKRAPVCCIGLDLGYPDNIPLEQTHYYKQILKEADNDVAIIKEAYKQFYHPFWKKKSYVDLVFYHYRQAFLELQQVTPFWYRLYGGTINSTGGGTLFGDLITCMDFKTFLKEYLV